MFDIRFVGCQSNHDLRPRGFGFLEMLVWEMSSDSFILSAFLPTSHAPSPSRPPRGSLPGPPARIPRQGSAPQSMDTPLERCSEASQSGAELCGVHDGIPRAR